MYGNFSLPSLPYTFAPSGIRTGWATIVNPGVQVHYVRSSGAADYDPPELTGRIFTSINTALAQCRSGVGDVVMVLPGHTENVAAADAWSSLVAGTKVIGLGEGDERPTFTWTAAASTVLLDVANVTLDNLVLKFAGPAGTTALSVANGILVSAAGCCIRNCKIQVGIDADQLCTDGIITTAAADDFTFQGNVVYGAADSEVTTVLKVVGADRLKIVGNKITAAAATDTAGLVVFATTASTDIEVRDNLIHANGTGNQVCLDFNANLANTGWIVRNFCRNGTDGNLLWINVSTTSNSLSLQDNYGVNNANERGVVIGTASS